MNFIGFALVAREHDFAPAAHRDESARRMRLSPGVRTMFDARSFLTLLIAFAAALPLAAADREPLDRAQALAAIEDAKADVRRAAVERLGEVGTMADADRLVARLRDDDPRVRELATMALWEIWSRSGDPAIDALYQRGIEQLATEQLIVALATFTEIIRRQPSFAEGWNKRATIYFLLGQFELSMKDCDEVLKRNPNHFGALTGMAQMHVLLGQPQQAIDYFERALKLNPNLEGAARALVMLKRQMEQRRGRSI
jgi:tetratricopeptide (TPR) repeat protein